MSGLDTVLARWRQLNGDYYTTGGDRFNPPGTDCSGAIVFANRTTVPWLQSGNSASMAQYAVDHGLVKPLRNRKPGDLVIYDKYGQATQSNGNRGHIGQMSENINITWEQASSNGCRRYDYNRLGWCMCVNMSKWLQAAPPKPAGPTAAQRAAFAAEIARRNAIIAEMNRQAFAEAVRKVIIASEEEFMNICWLAYTQFGIKNHTFYRMPDGTLGHMWWEPTLGVWGTDKPNGLGVGYGQHPEIKIAEGGLITGKTKELHQAANPIDLYYPSSTPGWVGHSWWTGTSWGAQLLQVPS